MRVSAGRYIVLNPGTIHRWTQTGRGYRNPAALVDDPLVKAKYGRRMSESNNTVGAWVRRIYSRWAGWSRNEAPEGVYKRAID
jgi:hypothetical protein